jgi:outer membrane protein assembly factor BamB
MKTGAAVYSSPAIGNDGTIYITSYDGHLYAIRPTGTLKWRIDIGDGSLFSSPAIASDGTIYVGSRYFLYSISQDGLIKWKLSMWVTSSPTIGANGTIYISDYYASLFAVRPNGTIEWTMNIGEFTQSSVAIADDGTLYVVAESSDPFNRPLNDTEFLYALTPNKTVWKRSITQESNLTARTTFSSPSIGKDGTIYVGSDDNHVLAFSPQGEMRWRFTAEGAIVVSPAIGPDGTVYVGNWINATTNKIPDHNYLYAINPDGSLRWKFETGLPIYSSPSIGADGTLYFGSYNYSSVGSGRESGAYFYAVDANGQLKWKIETGSVVSSPAINKDGSVYFGSEDGYLYAVKGGSPSLGPKILLPIGGMMLLAVVFAAIVLEGNRKK